MDREIFIVGAGASGLAAAVTAARAGAKVCVAERMDKAGRRFWRRETANAIIQIEISVKRAIEARIRRLSPRLSADAGGRIPLIFFTVLVYIRKKGMAISIRIQNRLHRCVMCSFSM